MKHGKRANGRFSIGIGTGIRNRIILNKVTAEVLRLHLIILFETQKSNKSKGEKHISFTLTTSIQQNLEMIELKETHSSQYFALIR